MKRLTFVLEENTHISMDVEDSAVEQAIESAFSSKLVHLRNRDRTIAASFNPSRLILIKVGNTP